MLLTVSSLISIHLFTAVCLPGPKQGARWVNWGQPASCSCDVHISSPLPELSSSRHVDRNSLSFHLMMPENKVRWRGREGACQTSGVEEPFQRARCVPGSRQGHYNPDMGALTSPGQGSELPVGLGRSSTPWGEGWKSLFSEVIKSPEMKSVLPFAFPLIYGILVGFHFAVPQVFILSSCALQSFRLWFRPLESPLEKVFSAPQD